MLEFHIAGIYKNGLFRLHCFEYGGIDATGQNLCGAFAFLGEAISDRIQKLERLEEKEEA